jgi:hypothetical protein
MARRSAQETLTAMASVRFPKLSAQRLAKLCQPTWLAGLISVGFHGVLFAASPTFTGLDLNTLTEPDPDADARRVPLVELTAAEQQRLPDFSNAFYSLSPWDSNSNIELVPGEAPLGNVTPGTDAPSNGNITRVDPNVIGRRQSPWPIAGNYSNPGKQGAQTEANRPGSGTAAGGNRSGGGATIITTPPASDSGQAAGGWPSTPAEGGSASGSADDLNREPTSPAQDPADGALPDARAEALAAALTYDGGLPGEIRADWEAEAAAVLGITEPPLQQISLPVPALVEGVQPCFSPVPHQGLIAALVADGKLAQPPELLISTGYPLLNQRAMDRVSALNFANVEQSTVYQFVVDVAYAAESCVDLKLDGEAAPTEKSTPTDGEGE